MLTTQKQIRAAFWEMLESSPDYVPQFRRSQNKCPADTRVAFVDYVDMLARNGDISDALAQRATL
jgi:hypothetical protein